MRRMLAIAILIVVVAACGGGVDGVEGDGGFVTGRLAQVPAAIGMGQMEVLDIVMLDVVELAERRGLDLPSADRTGKDLGRWITALSFAEPGDDPLIGFYPGIVDENPVLDDSAFAEATGIAVGAIETIVTARATPDAFTVLTGAVAVDAALPESADGVQTLGVGEDFESYPAATTVWNSLGQPFRFASRDGAVVVARSTPLAAEWSAGVEESLADDPALGPIARVLDRYDAFSAFLTKESFAARPPAQATAEETIAYLATVPEVDEFTAIGIGITVVDDQPRTVVAYSFADNDAADAAVGPLLDAWNSTVDPNLGATADRFTVVDSTTVGQVAVIELAPSDTGATVDALLFIGSPVFMHP